MLDVHPPHAAAHTWPDFWIHLGTIAAGLLLAIGLEQSVEAMHRHHQRNVLERDLRAEAQRNQAILRHDLDVFRYDHAIYAEFRGRCGDAGHEVDPKKLLPLPKPHFEDTFLPSAGSWTSARDSNELSLLPRELTSMYEELNDQREFMEKPLFDWFAAQNNLQVFLSSHGVSDIAELDPALLSSADRAVYSRLMTELLVKIEFMSGTTSFYAAENAAVVGGAETVDELHEAVQRQGEPESTPASTMKK
jgi:hypothetical protein